MTDTSSSYGSGSTYGSLAQYFSQSGGTGSPGKSGGAGYSSDSTTTGSSGGTGGDSQQASAQSGGSSWISAAASTDTTDKSNFSTPFTQGFGGIANNQVYVIGSPGSQVTSSPNLSTSPITAPNVGAPGSLGGGLDPTMIFIVGALLLVAAKLLR